MTKGFRSVPLDFQQLTGAAPAWDGGTVSKDATFKADVTVEGSLTANNLLVENGAEINGGATVTGGLEVAGGFSADTLNITEIFIGDRNTVGCGWIYLSTDTPPRVVLKKLTALPDTWTEEQSW